MSIEVSIAGIRVSIQGKHFSEELNPAERALLSPFMIRREASRGRPVTVNARRIPCLKEVKKKSADLKLARLLRGSFFYQNDDRFRIFFPKFVQECLVPYLRANLSNRKKLEALLKHGDGSLDQIIMGKKGFVFYDKSSGSYELVHRKMDHASQEYFLWPHTLAPLRLLFRMLFNANNDGIILHASSVEQGGDGYVFVGPGDSGKSTVARTLEAARTLSDDMTVIRKVGKVYKVYPNPWWNCGRGISVKDPRSPAVLKAIFFIEKSGKTRIKKLSYKKALGNLIYGDQAFQQVDFFENRQGIKSFYVFAKELAHKIPAFRLRIKKGREFKEEFYKFVASEKH